MKKLFCAVILGLSYICPTFAQHDDTIINNHTLIQRVDSLEYELTCLKWTYEINNLISELGIFSNQLYGESLNISINVYSKNFDSRLNEQNQIYLKACQRRVSSYSELVELKKRLLLANMETNKYSESERRMLMATYETLETSFDRLKATLNFFKIAVDGYADFF